MLKVSEGRTIDLRPRLVDLSTGECRLLDSGAQISTVKKGPEDKIDTSINLVAVNGSRIHTYGTRNLEVKINRKKYSIPAIVCDVKQDILGADFINKYKLGLEWDDFDQSELFIVDKRAQIRHPIKIVTVPSDTIRTHHIEEVASPSSPAEPGLSPTPSSPAEPGLSPTEGTEEASSSSKEAKWASALFKVACMKQLGSESEDKVPDMSTEQALSNHDPEYVALIKAHPELLNRPFHFLG